MWSAEVHDRYIQLEREEAYPGYAIDADKDVATGNNSLGCGSALDLPSQNRITVNRVHFVSVRSHQGTDDEVQHTGDYSAPDCVGRVSR